MIITASPEMQARAYNATPTECAKAAMQPLRRPPLTVWRNTKASEGPGDIAPRARMLATVSQRERFIGKG